MICPNCGGTINDNAVFCRSCGYRLPGQSAAYPEGTVYAGNEPVQQQPVQQPYQQQPYQQPYQPQYQQPQYPQPDYGAPPPKKSKTGIIVVVIILVLVGVIIGLVAVLVSGDDDGGSSSKKSKKDSSSVSADDSDDVKTPGDQSPAARAALSAPGRAASGYMTATPTTRAIPPTARSSRRC